jgi:hypothetical protein
MLLHMPICNMLLTMRLHSGVNCRLLVITSAGTISSEYSVKEKRDMERFISLRSEATIPDSAGGYSFRTGPRTV